MIDRRTALALALFTCAAPFGASADGPRQIGWPELMPKDWDAAKAMNSVDISSLQDDADTMMGVSGYHISADALSRVTASK